MIRIPAQFRQARLIAVAVVVGGLLLGGVAAFFLGAHPESQRPSGAAAAPSWSAPAPPSSHPSARPATPSPAKTTPAKPGKTTGNTGEDPVEPTATVSAGPDVVEASSAFAANWLNAWPATGEQWLATITPLMTQECADLLSPESAASVPIGRVGSPVAGVMTAPSFAEVNVPVVSAGGKPLGILGLELLRSGRAWLVNSIDWTPA